MKTPAYLTLVCLLALAAVVSLAGMMHASDREHGSSGVLARIASGKEDAWDETRSDAPPLAAGVAIRIAQDYVTRVPLPDNTHAWVLEGVSLRKMPSGSGRKDWIYLVQFISKPGFEGTAADRVPLEIPVRFDGTVPPGIVRRIP